MIIEKIYYSYANYLLGSIVGGVAGYYIVKNGIKDNRTWALVAGAIAGATIGSAIQYRINAKVAIIKQKNIIEN